LSGEEGIGAGVEVGQCGLLRGSRCGGQLLGFGRHGGIVRQEADERKGGRDEEKYKVQRFGSNVEWALEW
jgi:hypothetical protein